MDSSRSSGQTQAGLGKQPSEMGLEEGGREDAHGQAAAIRGASGTDTRLPAHLRGKAWFCPCWLHVAH